MKKILCVLLCITVLTAFCACADKSQSENNGDNGTETTASADEKGTVERGDTPTHIQSETENTEEETTQAFIGALSFKTEAESVSPGEEVKVILNVSECSFMATLDVFVDADPEIELVDIKVNYMADFTTECSRPDAEGVTRGRIAGFSMYTKDFSDVDICEITYKIPEDAQSGDSFSVFTVPYDIQLGTDASGASTIDITERIANDKITFTVK